MNEYLRNFDLIRYDFLSSTKKFFYFFVPVLFRTQTNIWKKWTKNFSFGGLIGYGSSCMDYFFANSKFFRLHANLHDAAGSVILLLIRDLVIVKLNLDFQVLDFLVT